MLAENTGSSAAVRSSYPCAEHRLAGLPWIPSDWLVVAASRIGAVLTVSQEVQFILGHGMKSAEYDHSAGWRRFVNLNLVCLTAHAACHGAIWLMLEKAAFSEIATKQ